MWSHREKEPGHYPVSKTLLSELVYTFGCYVENRNSFLQVFNGGFSVRVSLGYE